MGASTVLAQSGFSLNSVRTGTYPDKTRLVFEFSKKTEFRSFTLQNPPRIVLDVPSFSWDAGDVSKITRAPIQTLRYGALQPNVSRLVIELKQNVAIKSAFTLPAEDGVSSRIVVDFSPSSPAQNQIFGSLKATPVSFTTAPSALSAPMEKPIPESGPAPPPSPKNTPTYGGKKIIVVDAGHGGQDPGAPGANGSKEKNVTLAAAKELKSQLEATGRYTVYLTRSTDIFIKLQDRVKIARQHKADLFISLHADSVDKPNVKGASIYTLSNTASDAQTAKLAARENQADLIAGVDLSHEDKEVANILIDLAMRDTMNQSKFFANTVVKKASSKGVALLEGPHRSAGFAVLKAPDIPSVLIEMGFMSNKGEVGKLTSPEYRKKIASAIAIAVDAYFAKVQKTAQN